MVVVEVDEFDGGPWKRERERKQERERAVRHLVWERQAPGADLAGADLTRKVLHGADLSGADLSGANLTRSDLHGADLSGADLSGANLRGANLRGARLSGVNIGGWRRTSTPGSAPISVMARTAPSARTAVPLTRYGLGHQ